MKTAIFFSIISVSIIYIQQSGIAQDSKNIVIPNDEHSFSAPNKAIVRHLDLDIKVNFDKDIIIGKAIWTIDNLLKGNEIIFDINGLDIQKITLGNEEIKTTFSFGDEMKFHGRSLNVAIKPATNKVTIYYSTPKNAVALQWLMPEQTTDKKKPFMFTQGESIWTRTWIPCQDVPAVRFSYTATVTVPSDLLALMSAVNPQTKNNTGIYHFEQTNPIPSYLMALAVGDLQFKPIDNRTGVYAEPSLIDKAQWEFADLGAMVNSAEKLYGDYRWGRYDVLVMPPSFPYGGMENPNLTFLMPGVIAGDRSLVTLLAHELGHSWSGNLVTNATWDDAWLNEGFTTYVEHMINEKVFGKEEASMLDVLSRKLLTTCVAEMGDTSADTRLKLNLKGRNADDWFTDIPYEKGYAFLQTIEHEMGRIQFESFLKKYFDTYAFRSLTTEQCLAYMKTNLFENDTALVNKIRINEWVYGTGIPVNIYSVHSTVFQSIDSILIAWRKTGITKGLSAAIKSTNERIYFIEHLPEDITLKELADLDNEFSFTIHGNYEIKVRWYIVAISHQYKASYISIEEFMLSTSRIPSLLKLYKPMITSSEGKVWAEQIFTKAKKIYHPATVQFIEKLLYPEK